MPLSFNKRWLGGIIGFSILLAAGVLLAQEPLPPVSTPEVDYASNEAPLLEYYAEVQAINGSMVLINGQFVPASHIPTLPAIFVGSTVRVRAYLLADGSIMPTEIEPVPETRIQGVVIINGEVTAVDRQTRTISIAGMSIHYDRAAIHVTLAEQSLVRVFALFEEDEWHALAVIPATQIALDATFDPLPEPPVSTPEVGDDNDSDDSDDDSGQGRGRGRGGDG